MIKAVLFDMDGVLIETRYLHFDALNMALEFFYYDSISPSLHEQTLNGLPTKEKLQYLVSIGKVKVEDVDKVAKRKQEYTAELLEESVKFDPTIYCLWHGLLKRGYKIAVVSNSIFRTVNLVLAKMGLYPLDKIITNDVGLKNKPDPEPYSYVCQRLGIQPSEALAIEDGKYGIESATRAGCKVMVVSSPQEVTADNVWRYLEHA